MESISKPVQVQMDNSFSANLIHLFDASTIMSSKFTENIIEW